MTDKDKSDLDFVAVNKVDFVAQSFVRNKQDILNVRDYIKGSGLKCKIIAKIENRQGIQNIDEILEVSDGIMIARGDLGFLCLFIKFLFCRRCLSGNVTAAGNL